MSNKEQIVAALIGSAISSQFDDKLIALIYMIAYAFVCVSVALVFFENKSQ